MKKYILIFVSILYSLAVGGEHHSIDCADDECCDCYRCGDLIDETDEMRYFGGVPHVCIGDIYSKGSYDEKGAAIRDCKEPHICKGHWCNKKCCFLPDEFFGERAKDTIEGGTIHHPLIPTPPPVSCQN